MRVAVALPTLPLEAPHRERLDAAIAALVEQGVDVEGFAERPRDRDGGDPFPIFHYLRLPERHRDRPFDTGLALLGRDMRAWEPPYLQMHQFPGAVWVLDPVVHHLTIGGVAAWGRWDEYRDTLEQEFGRETGVSMAMTVAGGWGVASLYRSRDPLLRRCARQPAVCGATPAIVDDIAAAGGEARLVEMPAPAVAASAEPGDRIFLLRPNYAWPEPALRGLGDALRERPDLVLSICAPEIVLAAGFRFPAGYEWLRERVRWVDPGDWRALSEEAASARLLLHLLDDPTVGERALIERAMASGTIPLLLRASGRPPYRTEAMVEIESGRGQGRSVAANVEALLDDPELAAALGRGAREEIESRSDATATARALVPVLESAAEQGFEQVDVAAGIWRDLVRSTESKAVPRAATPDLERRLRERIAAAAPAAYRAQAGD